MVAELTALRDQIDEVDKALLNLLAKRLELVAEVISKKRSSLAVCYLTRAFSFLMNPPGVSILARNTRSTN